MLIAPAKNRWCWLLFTYSCKNESEDGVLPKHWWWFSVQWPWVVSTMELGAIIFIDEFGVAGGWIQWIWQNCVSLICLWICWWLQTKTGWTLMVSVLRIGCKWHLVLLLAVGVAIFWGGWQWWDALDVGWFWMILCFAYNMISLMHINGFLSGCLYTALRVHETGCMTGIMHDVWDMISINHSSLLSPFLVLSSLLHWLGFQHCWPIPHSLVDSFNLLRCWLKKLDAY